MSHVPFAPDPDTLQTRVFAFCRYLMTDAEQTADRCCLYLLKAESVQRALDNPTPAPVPSDLPDLPDWVAKIAESESKRDRTADLHKALARYLDAIEQMRTPEVAALLRNGVPAFRARVCERLLREHGNEVVNPCSRCGGMTRSPHARQCPHCFHNWH